MIHDKFEHGREKKYRDGWDAIFGPTVNRHVWRLPVEGEPHEEGGVCTKCGMGATSAVDPICQGE